VSVCWIPLLLVKVPTRPNVAGTWHPRHVGKRVGIRVEDVLLHLSFTWQRCGWLLWRGGHAEELVKLRAGVGAGIHAPLVAVPMLGECLKGAAGRMGIPHGPDIIGGDSGHCQEFVILRGDVGALDDLPRVAVPVLDQRLLDPLALMKSPTAQT
jgi:hypothetical protein